MSLIVDGITMVDSKPIAVNDVNVDTITANGVEVWKCTIIWEFHTNVSASKHRYVDKATGKWFYDGLIATNHTDLSVSSNGKLYYIGEKVTSGADKLYKIGVV